nr:hypothetical protein [Tanacetum cinerariifolium]
FITSDGYEDDAVVSTSKNLQSCRLLESDLAHQAFILRSELEKSLQDNASLFMNIVMHSFLCTNSSRFSDLAPPVLLLSF